MLTLLVLVVFAFILWLVSVWLRNASIVDPFWSILILLAAVGALLQSGVYDLPRLALLAMVLLWALRLCGYLLWRGWGQPEDFRYRQFRQRFGEHRYWWVSLFQVFLLQAVLAWFIALPLQSALADAAPDFAGRPYAAGAAIFLIGFGFEAIADWQLIRHRANAAMRGKVLSTGLWRYSRHPNYFGEAVLHFGLWLMAWSMGAELWTIIAPVAMLILLLKVSGVVLLESTLVKSKPGYAQYIAATSAFVPMPPRRTQ